MAQKWLCEKIVQRYNDEAPTCAISGAVCYAVWRCVQDRRFYNTPLAKYCKLKGSDGDGEGMGEGVLQKRGLAQDA